MSGRTTDMFIRSAVIPFCPDCVWLYYGHVRKVSGDSVLSLSCPDCVWLYYGHVRKVSGDSVLSRLCPVLTVSHWCGMMAGETVICFVNRCSLLLHWSHQRLRLGLGLGLG